MASTPLSTIAAPAPSAGSFLSGLVIVSFGGWLSYLVAVLLAACILIGIVWAVRRPPDGTQSTTLVAPSHSFSPTRHRQQEVGAPTTLA
jgi:hypothetical protein